MKTVAVFLSIALASGLLFVNLYTSLVDAASWGSHFPGSIATARAYYQTVNPGTFFRLFSPLNQLLGLLVLILFWKASPAIRWSLGAAFLLYVLGDVLTFAYFYSRNAILFQTAPLTDVALLKQTWSEWTAMNWLRSLVLVVGLGCSFWALHQIYLTARPKRKASTPQPLVSR
jgi:hypothetical protein